MPSSPISKHSRRQLLLALGGGAGLLAAGAWGISRGVSQRSSVRISPVTVEAKALGSDMSITALHADPQFARRAIASAFGRIQQVDELMSLYRPDSQISMLNREGALDHPHPWMVQIIEKAKSVSRASGGAFDITVQPLWELYWNASRKKTVPDELTIAQTAARVDWRKLEVSERRIRFTGEKMAITLNAIAQGFALDQALSALRDSGIEHALVDAGEIGSLGHKADGQNWNAGIQHPRVPDAYIAVIKLDGRCISTSGDYATRFSSDFIHHHIFNPGTGRSPQEFSSVTVAAPSGADADALSTSLFVMGYEKSLSLLKSVEQTDAMFVFKDGRTAATRGFPPGVRSDPA